MSSYILCKILSFLTRVAQKVFNRPGSYSLVELIILWTFNIQNWFVCSSIRNRIAYANEANIVNKDSPSGKHEGWELNTRAGKRTIFFSFSFFPPTCFFLSFSPNKCFPFIIIYYFARYSLVHLVSELLFCQISWTVLTTGSWEIGRLLRKQSVSIFWATAHVLHLTGFFR